MNNLIYALIIGIAIGSFIYIPIKRIGLFSHPSNRVAAVGAYAIGLGVTWWLYNNPGYLNQVMESIVVKSVAIIFAVLGVAIAFYNKRQ